MSLELRIPAKRAPAMLAGALLVAAALGVAAVPASAGPIGWQASGGWYTDDDVVFLGAGARLGAGTLTVIPNFEWLFEDHGSAYTLNLDATLNVLPLGVASGYAGAGVGIFTVDPEFGSSESDMVFNIIAGAGINTIPLKPFAQFKYVVVDGDDPLVFSLGVRF